MQRTAFAARLRLIMHGATPIPSLAIAIAEPTFTAASEALAQQLGLPLCDHGATARSEYAFVLHYVQRDEQPVLQIQANGPDAPGPLYVDFAHGPLGYRKRQAGHAREPLARAVGIKNSPRATSVMDATGGLGRDAFMLARLGCRVTVIERAPIMAALLRDGLFRVRTVPGTAEVVARMHLIEGDAADYLARLDEAARPDVVYLDPMYPERSKSALVKKEMRYLRALVGDDIDAPTLLIAALRVARRRVVVKRSRLAQALAGPPPSTTQTGSTTRFDIYVTAPARDPADINHEVIHDGRHSPD